MKQLLQQLLLVSVLAASASASAQEPDACLDSLDDATVRMHNRWLEQRFDAAKLRARLYWYGQVLIWGGVSIMQTVLAATADKVPQRFPNTVGAVGAWLTTLQLVVMPVVSAFAPQRFRRQPRGTPEERRARLRYGLELLEKGANRAALQGGPAAHAVPFLWSAVWGTYISARFQDPWTSVRLIGGGILLSEFRILSMPQQSVRDWEAIRGMICGAMYVAPYDDTYDDLEEEEPVDEEWDDGLDDLDPPDDQPPPPEDDVQARWLPTVGGAMVHVQW